MTSSVKLWPALSAVFAATKSLSGQPPIMHANSPPRPIAGLTRYQTPPKIIRLEEMPIEATPNKKRSLSARVALRGVDGGAAMLAR